LTPELAEPLSVAQRAVFADARLASRNDLAVRVEPIQPRESAEWSVSAHAGDPAGLLALTRAVSGRCPQAWLITIPAVDLDFGERFSTVTRRGLVEGLGRVAELLRGFAFRPESRP
jgi:Ni,Fe-hydrogenase maturation factor